MTTTEATAAETQADQDNKATTCPNCGWEGTLDDLDALDNVYERIDPGEVMPYGECPECGACCHPDEPEAWTEEARRIKAERERDTLRAAVDALLSSPALNLDELEPADRRAIRLAHKALADTVPA